MRRILFILAVISMNTVAFAKDVETIIGNGYKEAGVKPQFPQSYIFDKNGSLLFHDSSVSRDIIRHFNEDGGKKYEQQAGKNIQKIMGEGNADFNSADYTLVLFSKHNRNTCPPCVKQEKINEKVLEKLREKYTINYVKVLRKVDGPEVFNMVSEEEFEVLRKSIEP